MLLGFPVVSSEFVGIHNLLSDGMDGLLYPREEPERLKEAICSIFDDDKLAMSMSSNARAHALQTHDPERNYQRLLEIYDEIDI